MAKTAEHSGFSCSDCHEDIESCDKCGYFYESLNEEIDCNENEFEHYCQNCKRSK